MLRVSVRLLFYLHKFVLVHLRDSDADSLVCLENVHISNRTELLARCVLPDFVEL